MSALSFKQYQILSQLICPPNMIPNTPSHGLLGHLDVQISGLHLSINDRAIGQMGETRSLKWNRDLEDALSEQFYFLNEYAIAQRRGIVHPLGDCPELTKILEDYVTYEDLIELRDNDGFNFLAHEPNLWTVDHGGFALAILTGYGNVILLWYIPETRVLLSTLRLDTLKNSTTQS